MHETEDKFINGMLSRCLLCASIYYALEACWDVQFIELDPLASFARSQPDVAEGFEAVLMQSIDQRVLKSLQFVAAWIVVVLCIQVFAAVNQKRYKASFYASLAGVALTIILLVVKVIYDSNHENFFNRNVPTESL